jgi:RsiW-degrading membrane proteinase PrsW (M82 family)
MTPFEYVTVLISIILGLGITQIVTGIADIIHQWNRMKIFWPHALWIVLVFVMHIHEWWYMYELKRHEQWHLVAFLFLILYPILLFVLARILFPFGAMDTEVDFKNFYFENYRKFFLIVSMLVVLAALQDIVLEGYSVVDQLPKLSIPVVLGFIAIKKIKHENLHQVIVLLLLAAFIASLALLDYTIG